MSLSHAEKSKLAKPSFGSPMTIRSLYHIKDHSYKTGCVTLAAGMGLIEKGIYRYIVPTIRPTRYMKPETHYHPFHLPRPNSINSVNDDRQYQILVYSHWVRCIGHQITKRKCAMSPFSWCSERETCLHWTPSRDPQMIGASQPFPS